MQRVNESSDVGNTGCGIRVKGDSYSVLLDKFTMAIPVGFLNFFLERV